MAECAAKLGMRGVEKYRVRLAAASPALQMVFAYGVQEARAYADALPFGKDNQPRSPVCVSREQGRNRHMAYRFAADKPDEILRRHRVREV